MPFLINFFIWVQFNSTFCSVWIKAFLWLIKCLTIAQTQLELNPLCLFHQSTCCPQSSEPPGSFFFLLGLGPLHISIQVKEQVKSSVVCVYVSVCVYVCKDERIILLHVSAEWVRLHSWLTTPDERDYFPLWKTNGSRLSLCTLIDLKPPADSISWWSMPEEQKSYSHNQRIVKQICNQLGTEWSDEISFVEHWVICKAAEALINLICDLLRRMLCVQLIGYHQHKQNKPGLCV